MKKKLAISLVALSAFVGVAYANVGTPLNSIVHNINQIQSILEIGEKAISFDNDKVDNNVKLPVFIGENNKEVLNKINGAIEIDTLDFVDELFKTAEEDSQNAEKEGYEFHKYELAVNYDVHTANNQLISLTTSNYQFTGGAHGMTSKLPYNFDLATGNKVSLNSLFKEGSDYAKIVNEEIHRQIKLDPDRFFQDEVEVFSGINEDQAFYIQDGKLMLYFGQYEIAPYSSGIIEFEIPSNILKDVIHSPLIK